MRGVHHMHDSVYIGFSKVNNASLLKLRGGVADITVHALRFFLGWSFAARAHSFTLSFWDATFLCVKESQVHALLLRICVTRLSKPLFRFLPASCSPERKYILCTQLRSFSDASRQHCLAQHCTRVGCAPYVGNMFLRK